MPNCPRCGRTFDQQDRDLVNRVLGAFLTIDQTELLERGTEQYLAPPEHLCPNCLLGVMSEAI